MFCFSKNSAAANINSKNSRGEHFADTNQHSFLLINLEFWNVVFMRISLNEFAKVNEFKKVLGSYVKSFQTGLISRWKKH